MTEEEYLRMKNILSAVIEQQAGFAERHTKAEARMDRNDQAIAALLTLAQMHGQEITKTNEQLNTRFQQIAATFEDIGKKSAETDERINALVNVVERYISKN
jgi:predicted ArsR family transcriptional regulator